MFVDARYERIREGRRLIDCAVLVAIGITADGKRCVLGISLAFSEAEAHWRAFLDSLIRRGLWGVKFIVSDDHAGLKAAQGHFSQCPLAAMSVSFAAECPGLCHPPQPA